MFENGNIYTEYCRWNDPLQVENPVNRILSCEVTVQGLAGLEKTDGVD